MRCRTQGRWRRWQDGVPQGAGGSARRHRDGALPGRRGARVHLPPHAQPRRAHGHRDQEADADGPVGLLQSYCLSMLSGSCRLALPVHLSARIPRLFSPWHVVVCVPLMCRSCAREWYKRRPLRVDERVLYVVLKPASPFRFSSQFLREIDLTRLEIECISCMPRREATGPGRFGNRL